MILSDDIHQFIYAVSVNVRLSLEAQCACQMLMHVIDQIDITCQHMFVYRTYQSMTYMRLEFVVILVLTLALAIYSALKPKLSINIRKIKHSSNSTDITEVCRQMSNTRNRVLCGLSKHLRLFRDGHV